MTSAAIASARLAELGREGVEPVDAASEQRHAVARAGEGAAVAAPMPEEAPVITATCGRSSAVKGGLAAEDRLAARGSLVAKGSLLWSQKGAGLIGCRGWRRVRTRGAGPAGAGKDGITDH